MRCPKQNAVARMKSKDLSKKKFRAGYATGFHAVRSIICFTFICAVIHLKRGSLMFCSAVYLNSLLCGREYRLRKK